MRKKNDFLEFFNFLYFLRLILYFANTDVSTTKICLDTSTLMKSIMCQRKYYFFYFLIILKFLYYFEFFLFFNIFFEFFKYLEFYN
jgi:hypothetical protein